MKKRRVIIGIAVVLIIGILSLVSPPFVELFHNPPYKRLAFTRSNLLTARDEIGRFREAVGRYPHSLDELSHNIYRGSEVGSLEGPLCEYLSDAGGNYTEHPALNGEGGWYYSESTGEIRINLRGPLNRYLRGYPGEIGDTSPSEW